jgi:SH3-like domain-containing protein
MTTETRIRRWHGLVVAGLLLAFGGATATECRAEEPAAGHPLPRFVSLKSDRVNVRKGPGTNYPIAWVFEKAGLPVEVVREYGVWRQVRDSDGAEGWVIQNLLSGRRTAVVAPWERNAKSRTTSVKPTAVHADASESSTIVAYAEAGTLAGLISCDKSWCQISISDHRGYIAQSKLWGVYKDEAIE